MDDSTRDHIAVVIDTGMIIIILLHYHVRYGHRISSYSN